MRVFHVFRSPLRIFLRCGVRAKGMSAVTADAARDPWYWRPGTTLQGSAICVYCAGFKMPRHHPTPWAN